MGVKSNSKSYNPFSILTNSKISNVARIVGVQIGQDAKSKVSSLAKIQESDASRAEIFSDACVSCQGDSLSNEVDLVEVRNAEVGGEYGSTTHEQNPRPQLEDRSGPHGRWTCVVNSQNWNLGWIMKGIFWNIRELNHSGRNLSLGSLIRENNLDFIGIQELRRKSSFLAFWEI
jgi:hypothetical protein